MNNSINPGAYSRFVSGLLDTATNAGRYYRSTPNPGVLDFIVQNNNGALAQPGDAFRMSPRDYNNLGTINANAVPPPRYNELGELMPEGSEIMVNDGSVSRFNAPPPALTNQAEPTPDQGVLANTAPANNNRRDQTPMSLKPQTIDNNELMIRMGGAGLAANRLGATAALGASINEYGKVQDANRKGLNNYNLAVAKAEAKAKGKGTGTGKNNSAKGLVVNDDIDRAFELVQEDKNGFLSNLFSGDLPATGWGTLLSAIPGSDANILKNRLMTIKANISFDKLQAMREESPTGGALGQVSTFELQNLMAVFGSLEQSQDANELSYNLRRVQKVYNDVIHGEGNHPYQMPGSDINAPAAAGNLSAADAIVGIN